MGLVTSIYPLHACSIAQLVPDLHFDGTKGQQNSCQTYAAGCLLSKGLPQPPLGVLPPHASSFPTAASACSQRPICLVNSALLRPSPPSFPHPILSVNLSQHSWMPALCSAARTMPGPWNQEESLTSAPRKIST